MNIHEEYLKCLMDESRIYMIENFFRTMDSQKGGMVPFILFPRQKDYLWNLHNFNKNITTKPRQSGITTCTSAKIATEIILADSEKPERVLLVANKLQMSKDFLSKIKEFLDSAPRWFWGSDFYHPDENHENNKKTIYVQEKQEQIKLFNNSIIRATASGPNAARGFSGATWVCFDEAAFIENGAEVATSCIATGAASGDKLRITFISTPNGKDELYYDYYNSAKEGKNDYNITEFRWYQDPRFNKNLKWYKDITKLSKDGVEFKERIWQEEETIDDEGNIKYDLDKWWELEGNGWRPFSEWYDSQCKSFNNNTQLIAQELDVSFLGSDHNVLDVKIINEIEKKSVRDPIAKDSVLEDFWIWKEPIPGHTYIMAVDPSRGDSNDNSTIEIIDISAVDDKGNPIIEQVAELKTKMAGDVLGNVAYNYGNLYNEAFAVVDCGGGYGDLTVATMMSAGYTNFYYNDPNIKNFNKKNLDDEDLDTQNQTPGWKNTTLRPTVLMNFANALTNDSIKIRSIRVIKELETWIWKNGRPDHKAGSNDDTITALALGWFIFEHAFKRIEKSKQRDKMVLEAWKNVGKNHGTTFNYNYSNNTLANQATYSGGDITASIDNRKKYISPIYNKKSLDRQKGKDDNTHMWLFFANKR